MIRVSTTALLAGLALSGCTLAPHYERPALPVAQAWPVTAPAPAGPEAADVDWRQVFHEPRLQGVIELALRENRDLRVAVLNIDKARAQYRIQRAQLLPAIDVVGAYAKGETPASVSGTGATLHIEQYEVSLGATAYEFDLFGRVQSLKNTALEEYFAVAENRRAAQISLIAEVASDYLRLAADQDLLAVAVETLQTRDQSLMIARRQFEAGAASALDVRQAETQTEQARSDVASLQAQVIQDRNALVLVAGADIPDALMPPQDLIATDVLSDLPAGLPSEVIARRPDVLAAEHLLKAANANIGAARANFFPRISLTAATGFASTDLDGLFSGGNRAWSFTPQVSLPLFTGGANLANLQGARADQKIAVAQYERAVQVAFSEVADGLAVQSTIEERVAAQTRLTAAATDAQRLSRARYDRGVDSYLTLLEAQRTLYIAQQSLILTRLARVTNLVTLYKSLGGGAPT